MALIKPLLAARNPKVAAHARTALFERGIKDKKQPPNEESDELIA